MIKITVKKYNYSYVKIVAPDVDILRTFSNIYAFENPKAKFDRRYKMGTWDGKIRLFNLSTQLLPIGLKEHFIDYCNNNSLYVVDETLDYNDKVWVNQKVDEWVKTLPDKIGDMELETRDFQINAVKDWLYKKRGLIISATSSGKSLMVHGCVSCVEGKKLIIVPRTNLVIQLAEDFKDYGYDKPITQIFADSDTKDKNNLNEITISTWQSLVNVPNSWFEQFSFVSGDEAHTSKATEMNRMLYNCINSEYRLGTTATLPDDLLSRFSVIAHFGQPKVAINERDMIAGGYSATILIHLLEIEYSKDARKEYSKAIKEYRESVMDEEGRINVDKTELGRAIYNLELKFLINNPKRNALIYHLAVKKLKGNTLILFDREEQGDLLKELLSKSNKKVYSIYGKVKSTLKNQIRKNMEEEDDVILLASIKTTGTGTSIRNIHNVIFVHSSKSEITVPQLIGRGLRKGSNKNHVDIYDLADRITSNNSTWKHYIERVKIYLKKGYPLKKIKLQF